MGENSCPQCHENRVRSQRAERERSDALFEAGKANGQFFAVRAATRDLLARLEHFERTNDLRGLDADTYRDWGGHVVPAIERLQKLVANSPPTTSGDSHSEGEGP